jgi:hypothetical protein
MIPLFEPAGVVAIRYRWLYYLQAFRKQIEAVVIKVAAFLAPIMVAASVSQAQEITYDKTPEYAKYERCNDLTNINGQQNLRDFDNCMAGLPPYGAADSKTPPVDSPRPRKEEKRRMTTSQRAAHLKELRDKAANDPDLDPWASHADESSTALSKKDTSSDRAPLVDGSRCIKFKSPSTGGADWDYFLIFNNCSFPVQILTCTHDSGDSKKCQTNVPWGTSDVIRPGGKTFGVSNSQSAGYKIEFYTCNMSARSKNKALQCLLPKKLY